jgi:hypothetical protein
VLAYLPDVTVASRTAEFPVTGTLMPDGSYCESLARVAALLTEVLFALEWHIPTGKVVTDWRLLIPADVVESVFWEVTGPLIGDGEPPAVLLAEMMVCAADGMLMNLAGRRRTGRYSAPRKSRGQHNQLMFLGPEIWRPEKPG